MDGGISFLFTFCCGERGLLDPTHLEDSTVVHSQYMMDAGGGVSNAHQVPLNVISNAVASDVTRQAIIDALDSGEIPVWQGE